VAYATANGTASAGIDYASQSGTLSWADGDAANKTITIPIFNNPGTEGTEVFTVTLSSAAGATLGSPAVNTVSITEGALPPGAPIIGMAIPGNAQATVNFTPPASDGGAPVQSYMASCVNGAQNLVASGAQSPLVVPGMSNGLTYTCTVTASNSAGTGMPSGPVMVTPSASLVSLTAVVSRIVHPSFGNCDVGLSHTLPLNGAIATEPRLHHPSHRVVFRFNGAVNALGAISVTDAQAMPIGTATAGTLGGSEVSLALDNVPNAQRVMVSIASVNGGSGVQTPIAFLAGDVGGTRLTGASDLAAIKAVSGNMMTTANCRFDLNVDGLFSNSDVTVAKSRAGQALP
jgi:hypothetical protein